MSSENQNTTSTPFNISLRDGLSKQDGKCFIRTANLENSKPEWILKRLFDYIAFPHSFSKEEIIHLAADSNVDPNKYLENDDARKNVELLQEWSRSWFKQNQARVSVYDLFSDNREPNKKTCYYKRLFGKSISGCWDFWNQILRIKRYCFKPCLCSSTRRESLQKLFDCIQQHINSLTEAKLPKHLNNETKNSYYFMDSGKIANMDKNIDLADLVIVINNHDMMDFKEAKFEFESLKLPVKENPSLLPGEYLITHRNMNIYLQALDTEFKKFDLFIGSEDYLLHYGMPKKFCASEDAYEHMFTGFWSIFKLFKGKTAVL